MLPALSIPQGEEGEAGYPPAPNVYGPNTLQGREKASPLRPSEASGVKGRERLRQPHPYRPLPHALGRGKADEPHLKKSF